jgi:uncharacterized protein DUF1566/PEP-CTERM motif-containing protein
MKFNLRWTVTALFVVMLGASSVANATLVSRLNGQALYDTDLNITWLANANANGLMSWSQANAWAAGITLGGSGWRLPTADPGCGFVYNCTSSEMGHLFYNELGGVAHSLISVTHNANYDLFSNLQPNLYWTSTEYAPPSTNAWIFYFSDGFQFAGDKGYGLNAMAVHSGDIAAVPEPAAVWLFGLGLLSLIGVARRKAE